jgi:arylsulfatase A-like enzyme
VAPSEEFRSDGRSIVQALSGGESTERTLFWHFPAYLEANRNMEGPWRTAPASAIRRGRYKLIHFFEDGRSELYDLDEDIGEQNDLSVARPDVTRELFEALQAWWVETNAFIPTERNPEYATEFEE